MFQREFLGLLRACFPALKALRCCNSYHFSNDKLYILVHHFKCALKKSAFILSNEDVIGIPLLLVVMRNWMKHETFGENIK